MHSLNLTDETFDVNQSNNYHLLMQSSLNGFSYSICDSVRNKCILLKHFERESNDWFDYKNYLQSVIDEDPNLKLSYKNVCHIISIREFNMVPEQLVPDNEHEFQKLFPHIKDNETALVSSPSKTSKSVIVCPYPKPLMQTLKSNFPGIRLTHNTFPLINNLLNESSRTLRHVFHVIIEKDFITVGVAHTSTLDFINSFKAETFEDRLYYIVSILEKFKQSPLLSEIYIQNNTSQNDLKTKLQVYIGKVRNLKASQNMVYSYIFTEDILENFANILNLYHCE